MSALLKNLSIAFAIGWGVLILAAAWSLLLLWLIGAVVI